MYVENKQGDIDGADARIGWVTFSRSGQTIYYRGRTLQRLAGGGVSGNYFDAETREEYWVSGVKRRGSNAHPTRSVTILVDEDAVEEFERIKGHPGG
jgi:hypothetical protein